MSDNERDFIAGRAQERAMLQVLCKSAISRVFDELEPVVAEQKEAASEDVFSEEIRKWGGEPKELQGKGRHELVWLIKRKEELLEQATSQCTRAQQEREDIRRVAVAEKDARRKAEARVVELETFLRAFPGHFDESSWNEWMSQKDKLLEPSEENEGTEVASPIADLIVKDVFYQPTEVEPAVGKLLCEAKLPIHFRGVKVTVVDGLIHVDVHPEIWAMFQEKEGEDDGED